MLLYDHVGNSNVKGGVSEEERVGGWRLESDREGMPEEYAVLLRSCSTSRATAWRTSLLSLSSTVPVLTRSFRECRAILARGEFGAAHDRGRQLETSKGGRGRGVRAGAPRERAEGDARGVRGPLVKLLDLQGIRMDEISGVSLSSTVPLPTRVGAVRALLPLTPRSRMPASTPASCWPSTTCTRSAPTRIVLGLGAMRRHRVPAIVLDLGTATTCDAISERGELLGCAIALSMNTALEGLVSRAARLFSVELKAPKRAIGRHTVASVQSAAVFGYVGLVEGLVKRFKTEMGGSPTVIATAGLAPIISEETDVVDVADPDLTLHGLRFLYELNAEPTRPPRRLARHRRLMAAYEVLEGKHMVLGVTGSIAAYKAVALASASPRPGAVVDVIMTREATELIRPLSFQAITHRPGLHRDVPPARRDRDRPRHARPAGRRYRGRPATANILAKLALGLSDDMLTTTVLATTAPLVVAPAMDANMYENAAVQANVQRLRERGATIVEPTWGQHGQTRSAEGRLAEPPVIVDTLRTVLGNAATCLAVRSSSRRGHPGGDRPGRFISEPILRQDGLRRRRGRPRPRRQRRPGQRAERPRRAHRGGDAPRCQRRRYAHRRG